MKTKIEKAIEKYYITTCGRVFSNLNNKCNGVYIELKYGYDKDGYKRVSLQYDFGRKFRQPFFVHQLVGYKYLSKCPYEKKIINHKNPIKTDNYIQNLEWTTISLNTQHGFDNSCYNLINKIKVINLITKEEFIYPTASHVSRELSIPLGTMRGLLKSGKFKSKKYNHYSHLLFEKIESVTTIPSGSTID